MTMSSSAASATAGRPFAKLDQRHYLGSRLPSWKPGAMRAMPQADAADAGPSRTAYDGQQEFHRCDHPFVADHLRWQYFYAGSAGREAAQAPGAAATADIEQVASQPSRAQGRDSRRGAAPQPGTSRNPGADGRSRASRCCSRAPRHTIDTPSLSGSINLKGAQIDDLNFKRYHETVDTRSPTITLLSPPGTEQPYFAESGWAAAPGSP